MPAVMCSPSLHANTAIIVGRACACEAIFAACDVACRFLALSLRILYHRQPLSRRSPLYGGAQS
jgi:hypothetical protein